MLIRKKILLSSLLLIINNLVFAMEGGLCEFLRRTGDKSAIVNEAFNSRSSIFDFYFENFSAYF